MKKNQGRSFVTTMIIIAVVALLLRFGVEKIIKINIAQNESSAALTLKLISTALENYAKDAKGTYPQDFSTLTKARPAYLDKDYLTLSLYKGYYYSCSHLETNGYNCSATPARCGLSGNLIYSISTGGVFVSDRCKRKE